MKTEKHIDPTRVVVGVDSHNHPSILVDVLVEFDPPEDLSRDNGERYRGVKRIFLEEDTRLAPTHHHQRAMVFDAISRIFKDFHLDALQLGRAQERRKDHA